MFICSRLRLRLRGILVNPLTVAPLMVAPAYSCSTYERQGEIVAKLGPLMVAPAYS